MRNNYILGAGIAGLIAKYYNKNYTIISPEIGGQLRKSKNLLMTFFIHNKFLCKELLDDLKVPYKERRIDINYFYYGVLLNNLNKKQKVDFIKNKMCEFDYDSNSLEVEDLNLSTETNYLDVLDLDINLLLDKLKTEDIVTGKIKLINNNRKFLVLLDRDNKLVKLDYNRLISTIPANDFFYMLYNYNSNYSLRYLPTTYVLSKNKPDFVVKDNIYYVCDDNYIYNRVQKYCNDYVYEITGFPDEYLIRKNIGDFIEIERRYVGVLFKDEVRDLKNIKFIGRTAQWNHTIKVQDVIFKSKEINRRNKNV